MNGMPTGGFEAVMMLLVGMGTARCCQGALGADGALGGQGDVGKEPPGSTELGGEGNGEKSWEEKGRREQAPGGSVLTAFLPGSRSQVEDTMLDTYDLAYEQATRNVSDIWWRKLVAIHDTFGCCGKSSPLSWLGQEEKDLCKAVQQRAGCLQEISSFVREHLSLVSLLVIITLAFMVYGMFLTSFLWLTIHYGRNLDRKGQYTLNLDRKGQYTLTAR